MECREPGCTGVHSHRAPYALWCPRTQRESAEAQARYKGTAKGMLTDIRYERRRNL